MNIEDNYFGSSRRIYYLPLEYSYLEPMIVETNLSNNPVSRKEIERFFEVAPRRRRIWKDAFGDDITPKLCPCCNLNLMLFDAVSDDKHFGSWEGSHIISKLYGVCEYFPNIIPMCWWCNRGTKNMSTFDFSKRKGFRFASFFNVDEGLSSYEQEKKFIDLLEQQKKEGIYSCEWRKPLTENSILNTSSPRCGAWTTERSQYCPEHLKIVKSKGTQILPMDTS